MPFGGELKRKGQVTRDERNVKAGGKPGAKAKPSGRIRMMGRSGATPQSPMNLAAMVFMISLVPAKMDRTRVSRQARAMGYSSQYP